MCRFNRLLVQCTLVGGLWSSVVTAQAGVVNSLFYPSNYASLGTLSATTGSININTDTLAMTGVVNVTGVASMSQSGQVEMAVFTFDSINVGSGVTINVTGSRGLVLASHHGLNFASTLNLRGGNGATSTTNPAGGVGGPGAEGGIAGGSTSSAPPPADGGNGGQGTRIGVEAYTLSIGRGTGGGQQANPIDGGSQGGAGSGGGYGGAGGAGAGLPGARPGGVSYGDDLLTNLFGGSGGGGGRYTTSGSPRGAGGGGGGALELIAMDSLTVSGTLDVSGGLGGYGQNWLGGGGGGGGGILLAGSVLDVTGATILAKGGNAWSNTATDGGHGGGGGGGRVALYTNSLLGRTLATINVDGGLQGTGQYVGGQADGSPGTFRYFGDGVGDPGSLAFSIPEPSALVLLAGLGLMGLTLLGYRRRRPTA